MAGASEPASCYFIARLGELDPAIVERLEKWAVASCVDYSLRRDEHGFVTLCAARTSAKTVRQLQSLLRTLSAHWKAGSFGKLDRGWLALLTETDFRQAVASDTASKDCAIADQENVTVASECAAPCLHDVSETNYVGAPAAPKLPAVGGGAILFSLGDAFDARARAAYERLLADRCAVCTA
jgi:hypothetical protein